MTTRPPYQLTPGASKGNAFCWLTWPGQIAWCGTKDELEAQHKRSQIIEAKRAAGIDPGRMHGLGSQTDRAPARFAVGRNGHSPWHKSGIAR